MHAQTLPFQPCCPHHHLCLLSHLTWLPVQLQPYSTPWVHQHPSLLLPLLRLLLPLWQAWLDQQQQQQQQEQPCMPMPSLLLLPLLLPPLLLQLLLAPLLLL
jgi:hypothetical protein